MLTTLIACAPLRNRTASPTSQAKSERFETLQTKVRPAHQIFLGLTNILSLIAISFAECSNIALRAG